MLKRVLEPEVMDSAAEASDYDAMDHSHVNCVFVADLLARAPGWTGATQEHAAVASCPKVRCVRTPISIRSARIITRSMAKNAKRAVVCGGWAAKSAGRPGSPVLPDYSHLDVFIGKNAVRDVFPLILSELERPGALVQP